eukprot:6110348-Alexandrium_andersonii.AAC.1
MAIHVDDLLLAGSGADFEKAVRSLEYRLPFGARKYGDFAYTDLRYRQFSDGTIEIDQDEYANHLHEL